MDLQLSMSITDLGVNALLAFRYSLWFLYKDSGDTQIGTADNLNQI